METLIANFDEIDKSYLDLIKNHNSVLENAKRFKEIIKSVDLGWVDTIVGSSEKYKEHSLFIINDIVVNLDDLNLLLTNIKKAMDDYELNENTWEKNVNNISF